MRSYFAFSVRIVAFFVLLPVVQAAHPVSFTARWLTVDANEGCDVGDIDGDGRPDVVAGRNWFRNPDWTPRPVRLVEDANGYVHSNGDFLFDVNQDGRLDVVAGSFFHPQVHWYENPGGQALAQGYLWQRRQLADTGSTTNEFNMMRDLDGDDRPEWITNSWTKNAPLVIWRFVSEPSPPAQSNDSAASDDQEASGALTHRLVPHVVGQDHNGHGMGFGDVNQDGREDILVGTGWYERPAAGPFAGLWEFHPDWDRPLSCPLVVRDVDGDQKNDVVWGNPHDYGLFVWLARHSAEDASTTWQEKAIDDSFSQLHCLHLADLDGDGRLELITGKRVRAHNGKDPGGRETPLVCYYEFGTSVDSVRRHVISRGDVGIGLQIRSADLDQDGDVDIVLAGKDGTQILFNE